MVINKILKNEGLNLMTCLMFQLKVYYAAIVLILICNASMLLLL